MLSRAYQRFKLKNTASLAMPRMSLFKISICTEISIILLYPKELGEKRHRFIWSCSFLPSPLPFSQALLLLSRILLTLIGQG